MEQSEPVFSDESEAQAYIEKLRWPDGQPICPYCASARIHRMGGRTQAGMFLCNNCRHKFTVRTGTVMERSHVPLRKWMLATQLMAEAGSDMTARQLERALDVTYKTAWYLRQRIRDALMEADHPERRQAPDRSDLTPAAASSAGAAN